MDLDALLRACLLAWLELDSAYVEYSTRSGTPKQKGRWVEALKAEQAAVQALEDAVNTHRTEVLEVLGAPAMQPRPRWALDGDPSDVDLDP